MCLAIFPRRERARSSPIAIFSSTMPPRLMGALCENGTLSAADGLTIAENTMLAGTGVIDADVSNQGSVNPGTPGPGSLTINGNYTQGPSGQLTIEVESPQDFDQLNVNGTASLAGTLAVVPINPPSPLVKNCPVSSRPTLSKARSTPSYCRPDFAGG